MDSPLVSILILNYNGKKFLDDCFRSVLETDYPHFEVIMIDNLSTDDSVEYTQAHYPKVQVYQNGVNGGFSLAYNNAFKIAKGKYFVVLNNDVRVDKNWLKPLVEFCENHPEAGSVQPKLLSMLEPDKFEYAGASGGFLDRFGYPFTRGRVFEYIEKDEGQYDDIIRVFWTTGAAMMVRADALQYSDDFDVDFVHHMEEIDLCYRINLAGYQLFAIPQSLVYHYGGGIIQYDSYKKIYWNHRNSVFMMLKCLEGKNLPRFIFSRLLLDAMTFGWAFVKLEWKRVFALIHAYWWLLTHPAMIIRKRKKVQKNRKVSDKEIFKLLYPASIAVRYFFRKQKTWKDLMQK
ncbi:MAG: glycosyltransferase family 2 protein [Sphingobacteriales bacterium]|nr:glycosyltransferase family 2 protein [Sphingobacteriales bacterium]